MERMKKEEALRLIGNYKNTMRKFGKESPEKGFTQSVGFKRRELEKWLLNLGPDTEEIRIFFAEYTSQAEADIKDSDGRFTTILWPYNADGEPAKGGDGEEEEPPVNFGELEP